MPFYILYIFEMTNAPLGWSFVQVQASVWCAHTGCSYKNVQKDRVLYYYWRSLEVHGHDMADVSSSPNFYNIDARIKLFNSFFMYRKNVVHCNHLFSTVHPPYVLART